jgi:hypothetical protein
MRENAMAGAVLRITKGKMFQAADAVLAKPPPGKTLAQWYQQLRQDLIAAADSMSALATEVGVLNDPAEVSHVQQEALGEDVGFWPFIPNKEQIMREGFIAAYDLALSTEPTRPIETFWMVDKEEDVFEVMLSSSPSQVTLFWVTSEPPNWGACKGVVEEAMWLVASSNRMEHIRQRYTNADLLVCRAVGADDDPPRTVDDVQILRLRGD